MDTPINNIAITIGNKGRVTIPDDIRQRLGLEEGDVVRMVVTEHNTLEIVPAEIVPRDQLWFSHPAVRERVAKALADIEAGRTTRVVTPSLFCIVHRL
ncbi:MAG: AbrB/MazE/SpoVT family DNA-binding domain-containing protein [Gemmatimonadaceae bacterium]